MSKIFTRTYRARYTDINSDGQLSPADYARYIIDTAYQWAESLGFGYELSEQLGLYWVIRETEIQILGSLHFLDEFDFTIWMLDWKRVRGTRAFVVRQKNSGSIAAQGVQQVACIDVRTQRPASPPMELIENFRLDAPQEIPAQRFPRLPALPEKSFNIQIQASWQDLDLLEMVNNAVYIAYAEQAVTQLFASIGWSPAELKAHGLSRSVHRVHIQYHQPAFWGDSLSLSVFSLERGSAGGSLMVEITRLSDCASIAGCVLDWELRGRDGREVRSLPDSMVAGLRNTVESG
jgi:YbgC/YbaW family acyl-CoA thioester hydrolase